MGAAAKAVVVVIEHGERGRFLLMERAEAKEVPAAPGQPNVLCDDVGQVSSCPQIVKKRRWYGHRPFPPRGSAAITGHACFQF
jgi:hypothetical protein